MLEWWQQRKTVIEGHLFLIQDLLKQYEVLRILAPTRKEAPRLTIEIQRLQTLSRDYNQEWLEVEAKIKELEAKNDRN